MKKILTLRSAIFKKRHVKHEMRSALIATILITGICTAHAQPKNAELKPSVNAEQFLSATSGNNSLQTGQFSVNIPLFNLQSKGVDIPISLSFNAESISLQSDASSVGLGWSLLAGGVITRTIRDLPDPIIPSNYVPWKYDGGYLEGKLAESTYNPTAGVFAQALDQIMGSDKEPDLMNYSFLGYSGEVYLKHNNDGSYSRKISPDILFKIVDTSLGYKIVDLKGIEYYFEAKENDQSNTTSWFLTTIKTPQGGVVSFQYADEISYDKSDKNGNRYFNSKRITRIDYEYGYVIFNSAQREDLYYNGNSSDARRITSIELYDKNNSLIKGYELGNDGYIITDATVPVYWYKKRMKLSTLKEYGSNMQYNPPYEFNYDSSFYTISPYAVDPWFVATNTWAHNPVYLYSVDRDSNGFLSPYLDWHWNTDENEYQYTIGGFNVTSDNISGSIFDYFCMTKMKFPSGGEESYSYEPHTYRYLGSYGDSMVVNPYDTQYIQGKRLRKKEIKDNNGNIQISEYKYYDGILPNPSIHKSTKYELNRDSPRSFLQASSYQTFEPQNNRTGSPVYYAKVEEDFLSATGISNGKKVYYFEKMSAQPPTNYFYSTSEYFGGNVFLNLPNIVGGKQFYSDPTPPISSFSDAYATYMNYPVGRFYESVGNRGLLLKELTYNASAQIIRKIENEYTPVFTGDPSYGYMVDKFDEIVYDPSYINGRHVYQYLISKWLNGHGEFKQLLKTTTTHYFQTDSVKEEQAFNYKSNNLLKSTVTTQSTGPDITKEMVYPDEVQFQTQAGLSGQAASIKHMIETNIIGYPVQSTVKKGTQNIAGSYNTYKQLTDGTVVTDSIFSLEKRPNISLNPPLVNSAGKVERGGNFMAETSILSYDTNKNPATIVNSAGIAETTIWGYNGQYPIARILNYTYDQVQNNAALLTQLALLDDYTSVTTNVVRANIATCNQAIRNSLPQNALVTTYTYSPLVGVTSMTDPKGLSTYYEYDSLQRLKDVKDKDGNIIKHTDYNYKQ